MPKIPGVNHLDRVRALEKAGFLIIRQGKHVVMSNGTRILTIPRHNPVNALTLGGNRARRWPDQRGIPKTAVDNFLANNAFQRFRKTACGRSQAEHMPN